MKQYLVTTLIATAICFATTNVLAAEEFQLASSILALGKKELIQPQKASKTLNIAAFETQKTIQPAVKSEVTVAPEQNFKVQYKKAPKNKGHIVYINNKQAVWFMKDLSSISTEQRAKIVANTMTNLLKEGIDANSIKPVKSGAYTYLQAGNNRILTVDEVNAKAVGVSVHELAYSWANNMRTALGAKNLRKDYSDVSRGFSGKESRYLGHTSTGMASWYGGQFHGRRSSDGSRFNKEEYTAAHKVYPFGTLVKVTNLRNSKSCVVKITDRGPYAHGRIIDLSKKAAEEIGMLGSGVAKVKLEVVGQY